MDQIDLKELRIISYIALVIVILMFVNSFLGDISFRLTYINAKVINQNQIIAINFKIFLFQLFL